MWERQALARARVVRGDILIQTLDDLAPGAGPVTVVGNLPYSITTPAIEWILAQGPRVRRAIVMVQREYAERLGAAPGGKEFGSLTVFVSLPMSKFCTHRADAAHSWNSAEMRQKAKFYGFCTLTRAFRPILLIK